MTMLEGAAPRPFHRPASRTRSLAWGRLGRWVAAKGWVHVLLLTGVIGCVYPLVWMFLTSIKTDEELAGTAVLPSMPVFRDHSPYVRAEVELSKRDDVDASRFAATLPALRSLTASIASSALPPQTPPLVDRDRWASSAASALLERTVAQLPKQAWDEGDDSLAARYRAHLTPEIVAAAIADQLSRVELSSLTLVALDGRQFKLVSGGDPGGWRVESGSGALVPAGDTLRLDYHFGSSSDDPLVLIHDFALPDKLDATDIHKLVVALRADDSWHGIDASLDVGGVHWTSTRTTYLAQHRAQTISFQPPTFDDTTVRARTWVPLRAHGTSDRARNARLALVISPSSPARALVAKVERNYRRAFDSVPFFQYVGNSLLLVGLTTAGALFSSAFVAYAFARLSWPGRSIALLLLLSTMMVPPQLTMVPSFLIWQRAGWYNTLNPLWVPAWFGSAFFIFLMIQHMKTIPRELEEAARIDGLGIVQTWWYVIVPQLKPTLAAIAVLSFLGAWNEFMGPLIYLRDQSKFPLSLGLFGMRIDHGADWSMLMAANMLMTVPSVAVFFCFQRYFIEGMTVTGMKG
jgi:multiple sugar transport system permease protein